LFMCVRGIELYALFMCVRGIELYAMLMCIRGIELYTLFMCVRGIALYTLYKLFMFSRTIQYKSKKINRTIVETEVNSIHT
jgi:hypothetical protein